MLREGSSCQMEGRGECIYGERTAIRRRIVCRERKPVEAGLRGPMSRCSRASQSTKDWTWLCRQQAGPGSPSCLVGRELRLDLRARIKRRRPRGSVNQIGPVRDRLAGRRAWDEFGMRAWGGRRSRRSRGNKVWAAQEQGPAQVGHLPKLVPLGRRARRSRRSTATTTNTLPKQVRDPPGSLACGGGDCGTRAASLCGYLKYLRCGRTKKAWTDLTDTLVEWASTVHGPAAATGPDSPGLPAMRCREQIWAVGQGPWTVSLGRPALCGLTTRNASVTPCLPNGAPTMRGEEDR